MNTKNDADGLHDGGKDYHKPNVYGMGDSNQNQSQEVRDSTYQVQKRVEGSNMFQNFQEGNELMQSSTVNGSMRHLLSRSKRQKVEMTGSSMAGTSRSNLRGAAVTQEHSQKVSYDEGMSVYPDPMELPMSDQQFDEAGDIEMMDCETNQRSCYPKSLSATALLYNLGLIHSQHRGQDEEAMKFFSLALDTFREDVAGTSSGRNAMLNCNPMVEISILHNIGVIHYRQQRYAQSLILFSEVYRVSSEMFGFLHRAVAAALNCIGVVLFHMKNVTENDNDNDKEEENLNINLDAQTILLQCLEIERQNLFCEDGLEINEKERRLATTLNNLGRVAFQSGEYVQANVYYQESLGLRRKILGNNHADVAASSFNIGQTFHKLGNLKEAVAHYDEFLRMSVPVLGEKHRDVIILLKNLGQVYHEHDRLKDAKNWYLLALSKIRSGPPGHCNREAAGILNMLGNLFYESGEFDSAVTAYEKGLSIERVIFHPHSLNIIMTLSNIGRALMQKGELARALSKYSQAYIIQRQKYRLHPNKMPETRVVEKVTETLSIVAQIFNTMGKYAQAKATFFRVATMRRRALGDHVDVALAHNYLGLVSFKQGLLDEAMENFEESLRIRRACAPDASSADSQGHLKDLSVLMYNIASIHLHKGNDVMALQYYECALSMERKNLGNSHPNVAVTLKLIGRIHDRCGRFDKALDYYKGALDIHKQCSEQTRPTTSTNPTASTSRVVHDHLLSAGQMLVLIASVHLRRANVQEMSTSMSEAYRIYQSIGGTMDELELPGFSLYELSVLHPECAPAA